jgi:sec-independent protein translocase protein TatC
MTLAQPDSSIETTPPRNGMDHAPGDREMTMLEHLHELRHRLIVTVIAVVVGLLITLIPLPGSTSLVNFAMEKLVERAPGGVVYGFRPGEAFFTYLEVSLVLGVALAMPVVVYQILAFVSPALYPKEKRYLYFAAPGATLSFVVGALFCYSFMLPVAIQFLGGFAADTVRQQWAAEHYLSFVVGFVFWVGVTFELPIVMYFLSKLGVVSAQQLVRFRRYALVLAFVFGAMITPTPDPLNQIVVSLPIYFLFELGIILARFA